MAIPSVNLEDILTDRTVEEDLLEVPVTDRLFRKLFLVGVALVVLVLGRIGYLSIVGHEGYAARAQANMSEVAREPAPRGVIFDRFGKPLVENVPSFRAVLAPRYLPASPEERVARLHEIADAIGMPREELLAKVAAKDWNASESLVIASDPSQDMLVRLAALNAPEISMVPVFNRAMPGAFAFSHLVGYTALATDRELIEQPSLTASDLVGRSGLEAWYDEILRGIDGTHIRFMNARGEVAGEREGREPAPGADLHTAIDGELQQYIYDRFRQGLLDLGRVSGAAIAIDPMNGEVRAMVSVPGYDTKRISEYLADPVKPLFNRGVSGTYSPGSTIKPLDATAALVEGVIDPERQIYSSGYLEIPNPYFPDQPSRFPDWKPHGWVDLRSALARSSNVYFYEVGGGFGDQRGLGIETLKRWWQKFRLDQPTGIDLPGEARGFLPDPGWHEATFKRPWRIGDTYHVSIGQGDLRVTPIALLSYIAAVANGGVWYEPRIGLFSSGTVASTSIDRTKPVVLEDRRAELGTALEVVREGMRDGVEKPYGTSYLLHDLPIAVAAKTGTAQIENNQKVNAFFVGFAPYEHPSLALLLLIENAREGGMNTTPIARDIFSWYHDHRIKERSPEATASRYYQTP